MSYRRWPSYQAWRLLRRSPPRVRDIVLSYFEQPKIKIRWDSSDDASHQIRSPEAVAYVRDLLEP